LGVEPGESHYTQPQKIKALEHVKQRSLEQEQQAFSRGCQAQEETLARIL